ncbi:MAG: glycosyltransferase, partial [Thermodesulfobacteriota bacterium]|nr:glycosyltransferase [Thermodesulfobacteriota bacterium]
LLEIAVISDGSTDKTNAIIQDFAKQSDNIVPCIASENKGKTACLNDFVPKLKGDIILFSDANSFYDKNLIHMIIRPFADSEIGFVTGSTKYLASSEGASNHTMGIYSRLERLTKSLETRTGSCVGADGAVFAIRKALFSPLNPDDINDLVIPFHIVSKRYRGILEETVFCTEKAAGQTEEFQRQIRITNRTLRAIFNHKRLLNAFEFPLFSFKLFSHKLMKYLTPLWVLFLLITNALLAFGSGTFYKITFVLQGLFYACALIGLLQLREERKTKLINACHVFLLVNVAYLIGWFMYLKGETYTSWKPER